MTTKITLIGSTGLIGSEIIRQALADKSLTLTAITRKPLQEIENAENIVQVIHDFQDLSTLEPHLASDVFISALGTTIKTAGSKARFMEVDHDLPFELAKMARSAGCARVILISSMGADANSKVFYSKVKGQLEENVKVLGFDSVHILRPSMLLGDRQEFRLGELIGKWVMKPLNFITPEPYKAIHATTLANAALHYAVAGESGIHIHQGAALFHPK